MYLYTEIKNNPHILDNFKSRQLIQTQCDNCNNKILKQKVKFQINIKNNVQFITCSKICENEYKSTLEFINCLECNKNFKQQSSKQIFCSRSCSATNKNRNKKINNKVKKDQSTCLLCNKEFLYNKTKSLGKYCSLFCHAKYKQIKTKEKFYKGEISSTKTIKNILIELFNENCSICNIEPIWNKKKLELQVDHIDGNSDNNLPENLRLLCPNCHSQTETFCSRNRKNSKRSIYNRRYRNRGSQ